MENEDLYKRFLFEFPNRTLYQELEEAMEKGNAEEAFEVAHKMKGIVENLSLNLLGAKIKEVVEILRGGKLPDDQLKGELKEAFTQAIQDILYIKDNNIRIF